ncbi:MAG: hypothetical protein J2P46_20635 [Zavarzinella sp.]|nr:hypothetical protein [Zavarzinella sp.]
MASNVKAVRACVVVACLALAVSGCGSSPQDQIVGKWEAEPAGVKMTAEFTKDGKATISMLGHSTQGTYKLDGDELVWTVDGHTARQKVKLTATEMELTAEGKVIKYKKV